ncbi:F1 complex, delta/epsilon subunit of ATPase [Jimgerdemannia flammicorona]|uniref:ATP synthase subunit delta, mitochondrial n=1 Tax=Jimgerdemannia flammicorona TaxID=994334 RepID=A0A433QV59_9FUNG|nr:F1 complex, delta/epsilon subunit of ATPase [Jimgerdemannia flammicorona]
MNVLTNSARAAAVAFRSPLARYYASEASVGEKLRLNFVVPHQSIYKNVDVQQVNLAATSGDMGILANHVPTIEQLKPGVVEVLENSTTVKKWFVSGGFATINPDSSLNINAVEAFSLEDFSAEVRNFHCALLISNTTKRGFMYQSLPFSFSIAQAVKTGLAEAQRAASSGGTEEDQALAKVEVEVYEALQAALSK